MNIVAQLATFLLLTLFVYCGYKAHWFDLMLLGYSTGSEPVYEIAAMVSLSGLLGWTMRNEFGK